MHRLLAIVSFCVSWLSTKPSRTLPVTSIFYINYYYSTMHFYTNFWTLNSNGCYLVQKKSLLRKLWDAKCYQGWPKGSRAQNILESAHVLPIAFRASVGVRAEASQPSNNPRSFNVALIITQLPSFFSKLSSHSASRVLPTWGVAKLILGVTY